MYEKFEKALELMDLAIAHASTLPKPNNPWLDYDKSFPWQEVADKWDDLFGHIHATFVIPKTAMTIDSTGKEQRVDPKGDAVLKSLYDEELRLCKELMDAPTDADFKRKVYAIPPEILEVAFPIAIARFLLRDMQYPLQHRITKTFSTFYHRYGSMVMGY